MTGKAQVLILESLMLCDIGQAVYLSVPLCPPLYLQAVAPVLENYF